MERLTTSKVSEKVGMSAETVRFYEREGLIPPPRRGESGYRIYPEIVVERLKSLRRARNLGFGLKEIKELLALEGDHEGGKEEIKSRVEAELEKIAARIEDLTRMRKVLQGLAAACDRPKPLGEYQIVATLRSDAYIDVRTAKGDLFVD